MPSEGEVHALPALRQSEARFRAVFEQASEGIFLVDLDSKRLVEGNQAFLTLMGYTLEELRRLRLYDLIAHSPESIDVNSKLALEQGIAHLGERHYRRKDGTLVPLDVTVRPIDLETGPMSCVVVHDLASQKRVESERDRLLEIIDATPDFVGIADQQGEAIYGNKAMRVLRGPDSPGLRRPILEAHPAWAARLVLEEGLPTAAAEGVWRGETALLDQAGREVPVSQVIVAHRDEKGDLAYFSTIARDISEQKEAEGHLLATLKRLGDLQYAVDESSIYAVTDADGRILSVNRRFCEVSGYAEEELLGKDHRLLNSGFHPKAFFKNLWDTIQAGQIWRGEIRNRAKDGSCYWVDATIVPWLNPDGRPERYIALRTVITERKAAEERVRRREEQLGVLLRTSQDLNTDLEVAAVLRKLVESAVALVGARGGAVGRFTEGKVCFDATYRDGAWEPVGIEFRLGEGISGHVLATRRPYLTNRADADPLVDPGKREAMGCSQLVSGPILDRDGRVLGCLELYDSGHPDGFTEEDLALLKGLTDAAAIALSNAKAIAERDQHQKSLLQAQKLESLGILAGGIAHDFNNLLTAIAGNVALAQMRHEPETCLANIEEIVQRAADLTRQLLAYAGNCESERRALDLNLLVESMTKLLKVSISKRASLHLALEKGLPAISADPGQLQQVVMNLVINASDALGDGGGTIHVATRRLGTDTSRDWQDALGQAIPPGPYTALDIRDTGSGMTPEVRARIFDPFFTTKATGRGLGLSAILGILGRHGAWIQLETAPGEGTRFTLLFPPLEEPVPPAPDAREQGFWRGEGRVLLVDDDEDILRTTSGLLTRWGFDVVEARSGNEALAQARSGPPLRLAVLDLVMPGMDGLEVLRHLKAWDPGLPVVLCSGFHTQLDPARGEGVAAFLHKPFRWQELNALLRQVLEPGT